MGLSDFAGTASNAMRAAGRVLHAAATGNKIKADQEKVNTRRLLCQECPQKKGNGSCNKCGCFVHAKTQFETEACPLGKW